MQRQINKAGYLKESYHYFHLKDTAGQELDFHFHEFDKLVILISGRVDYRVESSSYRLRPWDVLLVKHHTIHKAEIDKSAPYERIIIYLDRKYFERTMPGAGLMDCFDTADKHSRHLLSPRPEEVEELKNTVSAYERAAADKYDAKIQYALSYINENFRRELTVDALAEQVFLSKYHFMRLFKAQTGSTVHAYIRQKRLLNAARLIREGTPAGKAAADSGFADYSAFHRAFRETFGTSPGRLAGHGADPATRR